MTANSHTLSVQQDISIMADLIEAYHGVNNYGGHTAEIYAYRLRTECPTANRARESDPKKVEQSGLMRQSLVESMQEAGANLYFCIAKLQERYQPPTD